MFYSLDNFSFLRPLIDNTEILLEEYNNYKDVIRSNKQFEQLNKHLSNLENYRLFTSFVMCVYSKHKTGTGQVTNGLFNFNYFMPDRNFLSMKSFFEKKFPDLYYNIDSNENKKYFTRTLKYLDNIPNLTQSGYGEYKNNCIFDPHVHDNVIIAHFLLNPSKSDKMLITSNNAKASLDYDNRYIIFRGSDLHSANIIAQTNMVAFGVSFYEK